MTRETTEEVTRKRWKQALDQFDQALPLAPTEREQLLDSIGQQDAELRRTVSQLLDAHSSSESGNFMESPPWVYQPIESNPQLLVGKRIGAYKLTQYLAKGGMGIVYLAERADKTFRRRVAVKIINADTGLSLYHRFRREVQILADLQHPNLVLLYDAGRMGDGRPFLVMEYVEGETLRDWLIQRGSMTLEQTIEVIKQAAAGLHAAHEAGIIHRDIKPANIVVTESNNKGGKLTVKVLDFGIAARKSQDGISVSSTKGAIGTLLYMSPEQLQSTKGRDLTPASDVYSLGLTAYELLTGRPANDGKTQAEIITNHLYETPPEPSKVASSKLKIKLPTAIDGPVMKALAKNPVDRYQSALEFAADLEAALRQNPEVEVSYRVITEKPDRRTEALPRSEPVPPPIPTSVPAPVPIKIERRKYAKTAAAIAITAIVIVTSLLYWQQRPESPATLTSAPPSSVGLRLNLEIERPAGQTFNDCRFALFKPGIAKSPATISPDNSLVILDEVNSQGTSKIVKEDSVLPGQYLVSLECNGFKTFTERIKIAENPQRPGWAIVPLRLKRE